MESKNYDYDSKKKLLTRINRIKNKTHLVEIFKIITNNNPDIYSHNNNGIFLVFDKLNNSIYLELETFINTLNEHAELTSPKHEYVPYAKDEITEQMGGKHKFSNKERALIKRNAYEGLINSDKDSEYAYKDFTIITESSPKK